MADLFGGISDTIMDGIQAILYATIYKLLYYLAVGFCWIVNLLYSMFEVMAGLSKVSYDGDYDYLINVFFSNTTVSKIYWGMALIGLTAGFAFAIAAVIKKLFDLSEKEKRSYGQILRGLFKSILTILCMSLIITMVLNATTLLMQQITYVFVNADDLGESESITYTDEEYAAMTRVFSTIGNFSLNPSYNNRYNLNKCFNEIRLDLQYLKTRGVFDFHYVTKDMEGNTIATWQSTLQKIANSASLDRDLSLDVYHESVSNSILQAMDLIKVNGSFKPLENYQRHYQTSRGNVPMDRFLFLMSCMRAAKNEEYNINPSLTDPLRGAYYYGEKSIYDLDAVNEDFDIGVAAFDYVVLFLICYKMLDTLATIILNCVGRIFNMLLLYLISPLVIAVSPLDDGAKFKQWTTAFIVQSLSVFGTVISMRVLLLFMPIVVDNKLVLFENPIGNLLTKLVIILGAFEVAEKATNLITGILADNAGWQSITAGDMSSAAKSAVALGKGYSMSAIKGAGGLGLAAAGLGAKGGLKAAGGVGLLAGYGVYGAAKGAITGGKAIAGKISAWRNNKKNAAGGGENKGAEGSTSSTPDANRQTENLPENNHDTGNTETNTVDNNGQQNPEGNNQQNTQIPDGNREIGNTQGTNGGVNNPTTTNPGNGPTQNTTGGTTNTTTMNRGGNGPTQNTTGQGNNTTTTNRSNGPTQNPTGGVTNPATTNRSNAPIQGQTGGATNTTTVNRGGNGPTQNPTGQGNNTTTTNRSNGPTQNPTGGTTNTTTMNRGGNGPTQNPTGQGNNTTTTNRSNGPTQNPTRGVTNPATTNRSNAPIQGQTGGATNTTTVNRGGNGPIQDQTGGVTNTAPTNIGSVPAQSMTGGVANTVQTSVGGAPPQNTAGPTVNTVAPNLGDAPAQPGVPAGNNRTYNQNVAKMPPKAARRGQNH